MEHNRSNLLITIASLIQQNSFNESSVKELSDLRFQILNNEISIEDAYSQLTSSILFPDEWYEIIKKKPIHRNLLAISNGKIEDPLEIIKIVSSMITQLIIRKIADPALDYKLVRFNDWVSILQNYANTSEVDIEKVKTLIHNYENLGIIRKEID